MEFKDNRPIYLQIADLVMEKIIFGTWREGDKIPSVRELAVSLEVNPNTVMHAYGFLQESSIIYNRRGIGYHVSESGMERAKRLKRGEFVTDELPELFRTMEILDIDIEELERLYNEYRENRKEGNENEQ
jgi:DNA-binding transcriptional regulator YhcF (GntR family)